MRKVDAVWIEEADLILFENNNTVHTTSKKSPAQASLKNIEKFDYDNILHKRIKVKPKFKIDDLVRTNYERNFFL